MTWVPWPRHDDDDEGGALRELREPREPFTPSSTLWGRLVATTAVLAVGLTALTLAAVLGAPVTLAASAVLTVLTSSVLSLLLVLNPRLRADARTAVSHYVGLG